VLQISGQILSDNHPMLRFVRKLGFEVRQIPGDPTVVEAVYDLIGE
jgi:acetyltransferase